MFVRAIRYVSLNTSRYHYSVVASRKRPVLYVTHDNSIVEVSLITGESHKIMDIPNYYDVTLACDEKDTIYLRRWSLSGVSFHRISQVTGGWICVDLNGCRGCGSVQYSHGYFTSWTNTYDSQDPCSHVDGEEFHYWDGNQWRIYNIVGNRRPCTTYATSPPDWILPYSNGDDAYLVYVRQASNIAQLWIARQKQMRMIWEQGYGEPPMISYSPELNTIYGVDVRCEYTREELTETYTVIPAPLFISIYQFECISLFNQCIRVIRKHPHLNERVLPHLRENVDFPVTDRYQIQKQFADKNLTDDELRNRYCLI